MEIETHLIISMRLEYATKEEAKKSWELAQEVGKMLTSLIASLKRKQQPLTPIP